MADDILTKKRITEYEETATMSTLRSDDVMYVDGQTLGTRKMSLLPILNNLFKSSGISVTDANYSTTITDVNSQPVNAVYTYAANLQSKISNLPSNFAVTILHYTPIFQASTAPGQVMLAIERTGDNKSLYFRTTSGSPAAWSAWTKVSNNADVEAIREELDNLDIETDKTLSVDGKPADAKAAGDEINNIKTTLSKKVNQPLNSSGQPVNGTSGQVLRTKGNGSTEWAMVGQPTDAQTAQAVSGWLDEHPEATTTVQDKSLNELKFTDDLKLKTIKDYVTPQMYGAKGDGVADDTVALQQALDSGMHVIIPLGVYIISRPLFSNTHLWLTLIGEAEIKVISNTVLPYLIGFKNDGEVYQNSYGDYIKGGILNGNNNCETIIGFNYITQGLIEGVYVKNFISKGIDTRHNVVNSGVGSGSVTIIKCRIENSIPLTNTYGIYCGGGDNTLISNVTKDVECGFYIRAGGCAINCHAWLSGTTIFPTSKAFFLTEQNISMIGCISDTVRYGVLTETDYVKATISDFQYYFNANVTSESYLNENVPVVFNMGSTKLFFSIVNLSVNLGNSIGKIISDNIIGSSNIVFTNMTLTGMNNANKNNIPQDALRNDKNKEAITYTYIKGNVSAEIIDAQIETGILGGYISYSDTYTGWGMCITIKLNETTSVQTLMIAKKGAITRRYNNGEWNTFQ